MTFEKLWQKLEQYSQFFVYCETNSVAYNAIVEPETIYQDAFALLPIEGDDIIQILPNAEIFCAKFFDDSLWFFVKDEITEQIIELFLQVRTAPQIDLE